MRILFLSHYALPHTGGIEVVVDGLGRAFAARGHEVVHVASDATRGARGGTADGFDVVRLPALNWLEDRLEVPYPLFGRALARTLRREIPRADVVVANGFLYEPSVAGLLHARARRARALRILVEHVGHVEYGNPGLDRIEALAIATLGRAAARAAEAIVVLNAKVAAELRALAPRRPVVAIGNGVDTDAYHPASAGERAAIRAELGWDDRPRVLFVGRLVAKKGVDVAVDAARRANGAFELVVVGPGSLEHADGVRVLGELPRDELARLYRAADAFALPSRGEGFPVTAQEAMASGLPVVLANDPAYAPIVAGAGEGVRLVEPRGPELSRALARVLDDADAHARASAAAVAHARAAFSWAHAADEYERLFENVRLRRSGA